MSVRETFTLDGVGFDASERELGLLIVDDLDWEEADVHWQILADKIDAYLQFLESEQVSRIYPEFDMATCAVVLIVEFSSDLENPEIRERWGAFGEELLHRGIRTIGRYEGADGTVREYSYVP